MHLSQRVIQIGMLAGLLATSLMAQESRATVSGTAADPSGAVIAGVTVKLTNVATGITFETTTNNAGQYRFLLVNSGTYTLLADAAGFKQFERRNVLLQVSQAALVDLAVFGLLESAPLHLTQYTFNLIQTKDNPSFRLKAEDPHTQVRYECIRWPRYRVAFSHATLASELRRLLIEGGPCTRHVSDLRG